MERLPPGPELLDQPGLQAPDQAGQLVVQALLRGQNATPTMVTVKRAMIPSATARPYPSRKQVPPKYGSSHARLPSSSRA